MRAPALLPLFSLASFLAPARAAEDFDVQAHYTKHEFRITMRDGVHLFTSVYVPKDTSQTYPILLTRTPYGVAPYGEDKYLKRIGPSPKFAHDGFIFVFQDVRGRFMSEGEWVEMRPEYDAPRGNQVDESTDTYDTIDWLLKNVPGNNGKAGLIGISYPGFYASAGLINSHPALAAVSPQAPISNLYMGDDAYHNGAFFLAANFDFYTQFNKQQNPQTPVKDKPFDYGTKDGYDFFLRMGSLVNSNERYFHYRNSYWTEAITHPNYDDFWQARNLVPHLRNVKPAVLVVGGWFDAEDLAGTIKTHRAIESQSPGTSEQFVMGPWVHGGWARTEGEKLGDISFGAKTSEFFRDEIELPFFRFHLKGGANPALPKAYVFETGRNGWRKEAEWPPANSEVRRIYLGSHGSLCFDRPKEEAAFDEYVSDPDHPVPYFAKPATEMERSYMDADQRFLQGRRDVLTYQTEPLSTDLTMAGPVSPSLFVSTSGTDSDFVVKVIDVYPADAPSGLANYQQLVRGEPFRGKFRNSFEHPEAFQPGEVARIKFDMPDVYHCFRKGHRVMIQIQSSWFPLVDRNPQTFTDIPNAKSADFVKATERIYHSASAASFVEVREER